MHWSWLISQNVAENLRKRTFIHIYNHSIISTGLFFNNGKVIELVVHHDSLFAFLIIGY